MRTKICFILFASLFCCISICAAQCDICNSSLIKDIDMLSMDQKMFYNYLNTLTEHTFSENKMAINAKAQILGIGGSGNFSEMQRRTRDYFNKTGMNYTSETSLEHLREYTSSRGYESFDNCINACMNSTGVFPYISNNELNHCEIKIKARPNIVDGRIIELIVNESNIENGTCNARSSLWEQGKRIGDDQPSTFIIKKSNPADPVFVYLTVNGVRHQLSIPPYHAPAALPISKTKPLHNSIPQQAAPSDILSLSTKINQRSANVTFNIKLQATDSHGNRKTGFILHFIANNSSVYKVETSLLDGETRNYAKNFTIGIDRDGLINAKIHVESIWLGGVSGFVPTTVNVLGDGQTYIKIEE